MSDEGQTKATDSRTDKDESHSFVTSGVVPIKTMRMIF